MQKKQGILSHLDFERRTSCYIMCKWSCTGKKNKNIAYIIDFERRKSCYIMCRWSCKGKKNKNIAYTIDFEKKEEAANSYASGVTQVRKIKI